MLRVTRLGIQDMIKEILRLMVVSSSIGQRLETGCCMECIGVATPGLRRGNCCPLHNLSLWCTDKACQLALMGFPEGISEGCSF